VPGVGAQGGDLAAALAACHGSRAPGLVNVSRGIAGSARGPDWQATAGLTAEGWLAKMRAAGATLST
jgi:orotidine-5'-phosphate decarboxylase